MARREEHMDAGKSVVHVLRYGACWPTTKTFEEEGKRQELGKRFIAERKLARSHFGAQIWFAFPLSENWAIIAVRPSLVPFFGTSSAFYLKNSLRAR